MLRLPKDVIYIVRRTTGRWSKVSQAKAQRIVESTDGRRVYDEQGVAALVAMPIVYEEYWRSEANRGNWLLVWEWVRGASTCEQIRRDFIRRFDDEILVVEAGRRSDYSRAYYSFEQLVNALCESADTLDNPRDDMKTFRSGRWSFDWYPADGQLRAYIARQARNEVLAGDYSVGTAKTLASAKKMAARWAKAHPPGATKITWSYPARPSRSNPPYKPPPSGNLPAHGKRMLEAVYVSSRERGFDEQASARQAWCEVGRYYYKRGDKWIRRKQPLGKDKYAPRCGPPTAADLRRTNPREDRIASRLARGE